MPKSQSKSDVPDWKVQNAIYRYNRAVEERDEAIIIANRFSCEENELKLQEAEFNWARAYENLVSLRGF